MLYRGDSFLDMFNGWGSGSLGYEQILLFFYIKQKTIVKKGVPLV